jgi:phosphoribosylformylglycinamidine synthase
VVEVPPERAAEAERLLAASGARWSPLGEVTRDDTLVVQRQAMRTGDAAEPAVTVPLADLAAAWRDGLGRLWTRGEPPPRPADLPPWAKRPEEEAAAGAAASAASAAPARAAGSRPRIAILQLPGVNCEDESARAVAAAGGAPEIFRWTRPARELAEYDGFLLPGGFSYQDRVRAGAIAAKDPLLEVLHGAAAAGKPVLGVCNGCQILVEAGLVPAREHEAVEVALGRNRYPGREGYRAQWVEVEPVPGSVCRFLEGLPLAIPLPMAHAEGRFTHEDPDLFERLRREGYLALRYRAGDRVDGAGNPNGSALATAALTNRRGNVLAMMPHPERAALLLQVPEDLPGAWGTLRRTASGDARRLAGPGPGAPLLRRLVELC